ncbi:Der1-like family-domain-containing protein [Entophlyctis helioformis]|nr:Der1-like family-domain-containing protein [Entophlyctis helioformis]
MAQLPVEEWFYDIPIISRTYVSAVVATTLACQLGLVSPYHLFYSWPLVRRAGQYWRLVTTFLYFGGLSGDFLFHMFFLVRYCRMLEEGSFRGRRSDFLWMMILGSSSMLVLSSLFDTDKHVPFLSSSLTFMLTYLWCRRNPTVAINFLGLFTFNAPYLPWGLGLVVGHIYYYFEDVYPRMAGSHGHRPLSAPDVVKVLCGEGRAAFARDARLDDAADVDMELLADADLHDGHAADHAPPADDGDGDGDDGLDGVAPGGYRFGGPAPGAGGPDGLRQRR